MTDMSNATAPQPYRINVEQFQKMAAAGIFEPDERIELIEGEILTMAPIGLRHGYAVAALGELLHESGLGKRAFLWSQSALVMRPRSQLQPDLMLLRRPRERYRDEQPRHSDVLLLIEVSDSTLGFDRKRKVPLYARYGIPEVWIVNLQDRCMEVFREPTEMGYAQLSVRQIGEPVMPVAFPDVQLAWGSIA